MRYEMLHKKPAGGSQILASAACRMYERFLKNVETEWEDCDVCLISFVLYNYLLKQITCRILQATEIYVRPTYTKHRVIILCSCLND